MNPQGKPFQTAVTPRRLIARWLCPLVAALVLSACGGGKSSPSPTSPPAERGMKEQLEALEKSGELPALDRSTDIAGPDADRNGIRDDIDAYIAALPVSEPVKRATRQRARVQQRIQSINLNDRSALMSLADASMASTACMSSTILDGVAAELQSKILREGHAITFKIQAITANTPERADRYMAYTRALDGTTTTYPTGKVCEDE